jgi:predicted transcriptional regulator
MTKHRDETTQQVYECLRENPGASLDELAEWIGLPSRSNVLYHLRKLIHSERVTKSNGKHRQYRTIEGETK